MAHEEQLQNLTPAHRREYDRIFLYDDERSNLVEGKWIPPMVGRHHPAHETKILYWNVRSCDEATIALARAKLGIPRP